MPHLDLDDIRLYYEEAGTGPALLLLHGWGSSGRVWDAQVGDFAATHRVVTLDLRGCGRSDRPATGNTLAGNLADFAGVIAALDLDRPVVIGSSLSGTFATELALQRPDLVGAAVSVDGPAYWPSQGMDLDAIMDRIRYQRAEALADWVPHWYTPGAPQALIDWTTRQVLEGSPHLLELFVWIAGYDPRERLAGLSVPIHYIHGAHDTEIPVAVAQACAGLTPGATVHVVLDAGHMPHLEQPRAFNAALQAVLRQLPAPIAGGR